MTEQRARAWCFTINNPTSPTLPEIDCRYLVYGRETGESGTPHLQGLIVFKNAKKFSQLKKQLPTAHLEVKRGTFKEASDYCKKDGDFTEIGELPDDPTEKGRKEKRRYEELWEQCKTGNIEDMDKQLWFRHQDR